MPTRIQGIAIRSALCLAVVLPWLVPGGWQGIAAAEATAVRSPSRMVVSPCGKFLMVTDSTAANLTILDTASGSKLAEISLAGEPRGICQSADGRTLFVAERGASGIAIVDLATRRVRSRIVVDRRPVAVALAPKSRRLYVAAEDTAMIWAVDVAATPATVVRKASAVREPCSIAVTPDERLVVVANRLPDGVSTDPTLSAVVSIFRAETLDAVTAVKLPPGSTSVQGLCLSPDGRWAYVVHSIGRFTLPITQLERGWANTSALTVIDLAAGQRCATMLLDGLTLGAADPDSVVCAPDGSRLWISHAGVHEISIVEIAKVHRLLAGQVPPELASLKDGRSPNIWVRIERDREQIAELENDLTALYIAKAIHRVKTGGHGPRGIAVSPGGQRVYVANYFSGTVTVFDARSDRVVAHLSLGPQPPADAARRGELIFHDATKAFQRWFSCATCHPNLGRVDALSWDFLRDGRGNPKDTIDLVNLHKTEPLNRRATRATARECARTGLLSGHMIVPTERDVDDLLAFLVSLRPEPSPYLKGDETLTDGALRGQLLFEGKADCAGCHPAPYFTDRKMHDIGTFSAPDADGRYDTPSLIEAYRTAPFLHDGRSRTIRDVLTTQNRGDRHGKTKGLTEQELDDLEKYVLSL